MLLCVLDGEDGQQEDINEATDEEAKEGGTQDDSEEIDSSEDDESEEDNVLGELLSSGPDSEQDATSGERDCYSIDESDKIWFVLQSNSEEEDFYGFG